MNKVFFATITLLLLLFAYVAPAQKTSIYLEPEAKYKMALELYNKKKYAAAQQLFVQVIESIGNPLSEVRITSEYYNAICAVQLFHPDAEKYLVNFINTYTTHPLQGLASFQMGNLQYRKKDFDDAVQWYQKVDTYDLNREQREELTFKTGYAYFMNEEHARAKQFFFDITNPESTYYPAATYYYGHISYTEGSYETALKYLERLENDENFGPIVPYYITHIYFLQEKYEELITYATPLIEEEGTKKRAEISRMIGESYYNLDQFEESVPYLETFHAETKPGLKTREDYYQMGYAYYKSELFESSVPYFEKATNENDSLAQSTLYILADSYLKIDEKRSARNAFQQAHQMDFIPEISEDALFNYAKLSFELSLNPFNEAILSFQKYIDLYPDSPRRQEAFQHLIDLYLTSNNYKDALTSMESAELNTPRLRSAYQRVSYYRGVEQFNNGDFKGALESFKKSDKYPNNPSIRALSLFWQGESHYRLEQYQQSIDLMEEFQTTRGAFNLPEYNKANYTIAYSNFKLKNYPAAITAFRKFSTTGEQPLKYINDAYLRIADSYFVTKNYDLSIEFYDRAASLNTRDADYAVFQKALVHGVTGRFEQKISTLQNMRRNYPETPFTDDILYELADTYVIINDNVNALRYYNQIINEYPNSSYVKSSMLRSGLMYFNNNEDAKALEVLKKVVENYPGSSESQEALASIRNIYVALDQVDKFVEFSEGLGFANITTAQQDSLNYIAAENRYMQGDCLNATQSFNNYIEKFPNGIFALNAHFYKAECDYRMENLQEALLGYDFVLERPKSKFSENAALRSAQINFGRNNYQTALEKFILLEEIAEYRANKLEARIGQMRTLHELQRPDQTIDAAERVLNSEKIDRETEQEAYLMIARSALYKNDLEMAEEFFRKTDNVGENIMMAEAKYNLAYLEFRKGNYQETEQIIFDYINPLTPYDYWLAKLFLLLADNYLVMENTFQARHTLQSIVDNYQGEELRGIAINKLAEIERQEAMLNEDDTQDTLEVEFK